LELKEAKHPELLLWDEDKDTVSLSNDPPLQMGRTALLWKVMAGSAH
jgi:hypothetical protein